MYPEKSQLSNKLTILMMILVIACLFLSCSRGETTDNNAKWSFVVYSDNRGSNKIHREVLASIAKVNPEIIINLGDAVYISKEYGTMAHFRKDVEECYGNFDNFIKIFYPSIGGHEERYYNQSEYPPNGKEPDNKAGRKFYDEVNLKSRVISFNEEFGDYYFKHRKLHFIIMYRTDEWEFQEGQVKWLKSTLDKIKGSGPIIVAGHAGGWFYPNSDRQKEIYQLLKKYNVDIALAADWHDYYANADDNMMRFRSGSAGWGDPVFIRFDVTNKGFIIRSFNSDGVTFFGKWENKGDQYPYWSKEFGKPGKKLILSSNQ